LTIKSTASARPAAEREAGTALVGTLVGVAIFLPLLLLAVQTLVHLYAISAVTAATVDAARAVATDPEPAAIEVPLAEAGARRDLGQLGASAVFDWVEVDADQVVLRVRVHSPGFLPFASSLLEVDRTVTVRTERFR
jgi:hypothetical protein